MAKARSCLFCGSSERLTNEHVYPQWLWRKYRPDTPLPGKMTEGFASYEEKIFEDESGYLDRELVPRTDRPAIHPTSITVRVVCASCNSGWMSGLETQVRDIFEHCESSRSLTLEAREVDALRRWLIKELLMMEHYYDAAVRTGGHEVYAWVRNGSGPPPGSWYLGLGRVSLQDDMDLQASPLIFRATAERDGQIQRSEKLCGNEILLTVNRLLFIVRHTPFRVVSPARLDHDLVKHRAGRPLDLTPASHSSTRPIRFKRNRLPYFTDCDLDQMRFWGHPVSSASHLTLLAEGDDVWVGHAGTATFEQMTHAHGFQIPDDNEE